jgi:hypothetical protein
MKDGMIRCVRCKGRKKLFKMGSIYSYTNTGGIEVKCPMCLGEGHTLSLAEAIKEAKPITGKNKKEKDCKDAEEPREEGGKTEK